MLSERVGWIPDHDAVSDAIRSDYDWIDDMSITEMECVQGAFRSKNPNALFLLRNPSFLQTLPDGVKMKFTDEIAVGSYKAACFREKIDEYFPDDQKMLFYAKYSGRTDASGVPFLSGFESLMIEKVTSFFKQRIEAQYPMLSESASNKWQDLTDSHEIFKDDEASLIGDLPVWNNQIVDFKSYLKKEGDKSPYILTAVSGSGKSSCLAVFLNRVSTDYPDYKTFFHFVGAVPGSVSYVQLVKRIAVFLCLDESKPLSIVVGSIKNQLNSTKDNVLIVIDAYNQLDEMSLTWLPCPLKANVNVIITGREDVADHLQKNYSRELTVNRLMKMDEAGRRKLVQTSLGRYNKTLDNEQLDLLLSKESSSSYYWLSLACEELRIFGHFALLTEKIASLPDNLVELQCQILHRLESELDTRSWLLVASLCLMATSKTGLLEDELLQMLAEPPNILPDHLRENRFSEKLALKKWKEIQRSIRPFVKYNGDTAENRMNIYHSSFKEAVEKVYFSTESKTYAWFHEKLAAYFEKCLRLDRKLEEYPYHLAESGQKEKLADFLCDSEIIAGYFNLMFSKDLAQLWGSVDSDYNEMAIRYTNLSNELVEDSELHLGERVSQILVLADICFQNGKFQESLNILETVTEHVQMINEETESHFFRAKLQYQKAKSLERNLFLDKKNANETNEEMMEIERELTSSYELLKDYSSNSEILTYCGDICNRMAMLLYRKARRANRENNTTLSEKYQHDAGTWLDSGEGCYLRNGDLIGFANCQISRGIVEKDVEKKREYYTKAEKMLGGGGLHLTYGRFCRNKGRFHQIVKELMPARKYLEGFFHNSMSLYGEKHPETRRASELLDDLNLVAKAE
ncbi:telomerase protein component 1-like isoform X2 [Convolutriloba macropyga]